MFYSSINTDFASYQTKIAFGLTKRQIICFLMAAALGLPTYFCTKKLVGTDIAGILMVVIMTPFFLLGLYQKNGKNLETVIKQILRERKREKVRKVTNTPLLSQVTQTAAYSRHLKAEKAEKSKKRKKDKKDKSKPENVLREPFTKPDDKNSSEMLIDYATMMHKNGKLHKRGPVTAAESLPFKRMSESGICTIGDGNYSIMLKLSDMNYVQLDDNEQKEIWSLWCMFLNTFDYDASFQFCFFNHEADIEGMAKKLEIAADEDSDKRAQVIKDLNDHISKIIEGGNKGLTKDMYLVITFNTTRKKVVSKAKEYAERIKNDLYDKLGVKAVVLNGYERLSVLFAMINLQSDERMNLSFDPKENGGINEKEQIINHPFVFGKKIDQFESGSKVCTASFLKIDANQVSDRLLTKFLDIDCGIILSMHIEPVSRDKASKDVRRLVSDMQKMVIDEQKNASNRGYSMSNVSAPLKNSLEQAEKILDGITQNDEKMFMVTFLIVLFADNNAKLDRNFGLVRSIANEENCELIKLEHEQEDGFFSALPIGKNSIDIKRQLTTTSLGMFLPFKIKELVMLSKQALCFGKNKLTGSIIMADIKKLPNPNTIILGTPGRGKSMAIKLLILQILSKLEDYIFINDPEGEYSPPVKLFGGVVIKLSQKGKNFINPFHIDPEMDRNTDFEADKSSFMMSWFELIMGPGKSEPNDKSIIDRCVRKIYEKFKTTWDQADIPILEDFYDELGRQEGKRAKYLQEVLEVYVHGGLNFFNNRTNIDLSNRLVCFDSRELGEHLKPLAMLIVQDIVWGRISSNRDLKKYTWYISDEFHLLLRDPQTAQYSRDLYKRARKYGGIPVAITQNVTDMLDSTEAQSIFYNSDCFLLLGQDTGDADRLAEALKLSKEQYKCLLTRGKGEGLFIYGDTILPFENRIDDSSELYKLITTKVTEVEV